MGAAVYYAVDSSVQTVLLVNFHCVVCCWSGSRSLASVTKLLTKTPLGYAVYKKTMELVFLKFLPMFILKGIKLFHQTH